MYYLFIRSKKDIKKYMSESTGARKTEKKEENA